MTKTCQEGYKVVKPPTASSDRGCEPCPVSYETTAVNQESCVPCGEDYFTSDPGQRCRPRDAAIECQPGTFFDPGTGSEEPSCITCEEGKFSTTVNSLQCANWRPCYPGDRIIADAPGTTSSDRECEPCPVGEVSSILNARNCVPCDPTQGFYQDIVSQNSGIRRHHLATMLTGWIS